MEFITRVTPEPMTRKIKFGEQMVFMGSCFSDNIGMYMYHNGFRTLVNPMGTLYNPLSIERCIKKLLKEELFTADDLFEYNDLYHSFMHHGSYSGIHKKETLDMINDSFLKGINAVQEMEWLCLTWGTAFVYRYKETGEVVTNCHKIPDYSFERKLCSIEELLQYWEPLIQTLISKNNELKIIITVSPIRHLKDGAHGNQVSKAILHLFTYELQKQFPDHIIYFPAYEIMMDELRDYRFYKEDMAHPSDLAIKYISQKFKDWIITPELYDAMTMLSKIKSTFAHRPLHEDDPNYMLMMEQAEHKLKALKNKYPLLYLNDEELEQRL
ncbi:GSCFA domain-containing protein [Porphyromonas pogonae]|uniref:GSCFA domain-containing protein n=1 Tax=Porphyromonas pogonae TaxID=867595 RepID=UPI002E77428A|nr:GSCFA domain-containing protein [Porphyromonas pogonae]